jgi:hypothetical protein
MHHQHQAEGHPWDSNMLNEDSVEFDQGVLWQ